MNIKREFVNAPAPADQLSDEVAEFLLACRHSNMQTAKSICGLGAYLACRHCGKVEKLTEEAVWMYLACGWPRCCGETMELRR